MSVKVKVVREMHSPYYTCMVMGTMGPACMAESLSQNPVHRDLWLAVQFKKFLNERVCPVVF